MKNNDKSQGENNGTEKMEHTSIYDALASVTREIGAIKKDQKNTTQGFAYRGIESFLNEIHVLYARHGILVFTDVLNIEEAERTTKSGGMMLYPKAHVKFTWMHEGGTFHTATVVGSAMDSGDKGLNKCYSIAYKYALMFLHNIPTADIVDPDATSPEAIKPKEQQQTPPQQTPPPPVEKKKITEVGSAAYKSALGWMIIDPAKHTIAKLQANYDISPVCLAQLAIDAKLAIGGEKPSETKERTNKTT